MDHPGRRAALAAAVLAGVACTDPILPDREAPYGFALGGDVFRWPADRLPVRYFVAPGPLAAHVTAAIGAWERQFLYGEFRGDLTDDSLAADVLIRIEGDPPPDATPSGTVPPVGACRPAVTVFPPLSSDRFSGPIRVTLRWDPASDAVLVADCLRVQTTHELGHTLGLLAESDGDADVMNTNPRTLTPSPRDRSTVQILYRMTPTLFPADPQ